MGLGGSAGGRLRRKAGRGLGGLVREVLVMLDCPMSRHNWASLGRGLGREGRRLRLTEHRRAGCLMGRGVTAGLRHLKGVVGLVLMVILISRW